VTFALTLGKGQEPVSGQAHVVSAIRQQGNSRISFAIDFVSEENGERLELALFDAVLLRLK
jgi:hypothetical protein